MSNFLAWDIIDSFGCQYLLEWGCIFSLGYVAVEDEPGVVFIIGEHTTVGFQNGRELLVGPLDILEGHIEHLHASCEVLGSG